MSTSADKVVEALRASLKETGRSVSSTSS
ncbi:polyketide synthase docking domain-containing protein [Micromonospora sp. BRA006-A]|nr:polyketide synthase docking domain-containing protein [Micromonospora sp. BRA006-A]